MPEKSRPRFLSFADFLGWLERKGLFHMELGLRRMMAATRSLNIDMDGVVAIQVLGTNGKGSVCAFLAALSRASGFRTGTYISPHFVSPLERVLIDGRPADEGAWLRAANEIFATYSDAEELTYFEFLTLLALLVFREAGVRVYILEAGLGGKNDATSSIPVAARCFAPIAMDHAAIIGPRLADIARDKAAVIEPGSLNFSAPQYPDAKKILMEAAREASLKFAEPLSPRPLGLAGSHQLANAAVALQCWRALFPEADDAALRDAFIPGRLQFIRDGEREFILDGAHNPHAALNLARQLKNLGIKPAALIFSTLADKDWKTTLGILLNNFKDAATFVTELDNPRAAKGADQLAYIKSVHPGRESCLAAFDECLNLAATRGAPVALCGSLYLLSEFYSLSPQCLFKTNIEEN